MKSINRRKFIGVTGAIGASTLFPQTGTTKNDPTTMEESYSILYDATRCIACRSCVQRCKDVNNLKPEPNEIDGVPFYMPTDLSPNDWTVIQVYKDEAEGEINTPNKWSFIKKNCMHCIHPSCVAACPVAALQKTEKGPVLYDEHRCMGCRYCMIACPYNVPRYEWRDRSPRVQKCTFDGACVTACPVGALTDGPRNAMIKEAHHRIDEHPDTYVNHVYGEHEGGGTGYLIIAGIHHIKFGLPLLDKAAHSTYADAIMSGLPGWIIGLGLFLGGLYQMDKHLQKTEAIEVSEQPREEQ